VLRAGLPVLGLHRPAFEVLRGEGLYPSCRGVYNDMLIRRKRKPGSRPSSVRTDGAVEFGNGDNGGRPTRKTAPSNERDWPCFTRRESSRVLHESRFGAYRVLWLILLFKLVAVLVQTG